MIGLLKLGREALSGFLGKMRESLLQHRVIQFLTDQYFPWCLANDHSPPADSRLARSYRRYHGILPDLVNQETIKFLKGYIVRPYLQFIKSTGREPSPDFGDPTETGLAARYHWTVKIFGAVMLSVEADVKETLRLAEENEYRDFLQTKVAPFYRRHGCAPTTRSDRWLGEREIGLEYIRLRKKYKSITDEFLISIYRYPHPIDSPERFDDFLERVYFPWTLANGRMPAQVRPVRCVADKVESGVYRKFRDGSNRFPEILEKHVPKLKNYPTRYWSSFRLYLIYCFTHGEVIPKSSVDKKIDSWYRYHSSLGYRPLRVFLQVWTAAQEGNHEAIEILRYIRRDYLGMP